MAKSISSEREYQKGEEFLTNQDLSIFNNGDYVNIPEDTLFTIVDVEAGNEYKVYFEGHGNVETDWHRLSGEEIDEMRKSAMNEY